MGLVEMMIGIIGATIVLAISLIYWLTKPYSEPIVTKGKIIEKYEIKGSAHVLSLSNFGGFTIYNIPDSFNILALMENGDKSLFKVSKDKYDVLEIDDSIKFIEYSQIRKMLEKNSRARKF